MRINHFAVEKRAVGAELNGRSRYGYSSFPKHSGARARTCMYNYRLPIRWQGGGGGAYQIKRVRIATSYYHLSAEERAVGVGYRKNSSPM